MQKIIYIMGAGRSGTTLLDIMLGNNPQVFSAGELNRFFKYNGVPKLVDKQSKSAIFWNAYNAKLPADWRADQYKGKHLLCSSFEYHSGIFKLLFPVFNKSLLSYKACIQTMFSVLDQMITQPVLIDSSKYPMRGYYLARFLNCEMTYIYIKRNPLDVIQSFAKKDIEQPAKGWLMTNLYMAGVNIICMYILKKLNKKNKTITICYDELVSEPVKTLNNIGKKLNIDVTHSVKLAEHNEPFYPGLLFDGNRIRLEDKIFLKINNKKTKASSLKDHIALMVQSIWWN